MASGLRPAHRPPGRDRTDRGQHKADRRLTAFVGVEAALQRLGRENIADALRRAGVLCARARDRRSTFCRSSTILRTLAS
jgi:hypothetical protein